MAQPTGITSTYDYVGQREELHDQIFMISPADTPVLSMASAISFSSKHPEWQTDTLRAVAANAQIEGDTYSYTQKAVTTRIGNYTQISRETGMVTATDEAVDKAGRDSDLEREKLKSGTLLKKDIELGLVSNVASVAGNDSTARVSAGFPAWITTNDSRGAAGADGGFSGGLVTAATNGTQRAFTKSIMDTCLQNAFASGGNVTKMVCSVYIKTVFVTFMSDANVANLRKDITTYEGGGAGKQTLVGSVEFYKGPFSTIEIVPNRTMTEGGAGVARNVLFIDQGMFKVGWLRRIKEDPNVTANADGTPYAMVGEWALKMNNEAAHSVAADVFGLTAST